MNYYLKLDLCLEGKKPSETFAIINEHNIIPKSLEGYHRGWSPYNRMYLGKWIIRKVIIIHKR